MRFYHFNRTSSRNHLSHRDNEGPFFSGARSGGAIEHSSSFFDAQPGRTHGFFSHVQTKLNESVPVKTGTPGDPWEREADRMADLVTGNSEYSGRNNAGGLPGGNRIQTKCAECEAEEANRLDGDAGFGKSGPVRLKPIFESGMEKDVPIQTQCEACREETEQKLQKKDSAGQNAAGTAREKGGKTGMDVNSGAFRKTLSAEKGHGSPLPGTVKGSMESAFGTDFSKVKIHTGSQATKMNRDLHALAFTHGHDIFFNQGTYDPGSKNGRHLLAHELTHVVQQSQINHDRIDMACLGSPPCPAPGSSTPIPGSAEDFGEQEEAVEQGPRARRKGMTCDRATSTTHAGRARQLEILLNAHDPGTRAQIHGIFIDADLSSGTGAMTAKCDGPDGWEGFALPAGCTVPAFAGATKPCVFVHGNLNQEAFRFNQTTDPVIGGLPREDWRLQTLQTLIHEAQHAVFDSAVAGRAAPAGTAGCPRSAVMSELSELNAIMSEFPIIFRAIPAAPGPARTTALTRLDNWFNHAITNPHESLSGTLRAMRCECDCAEVNAHVSDIFNFVSSTWTAAEKNAFNTELRRSFWDVHPFELNWPL